MNPTLRRIMDARAMELLTQHGIDTSSDNRTAIEIAQAYNLKVGPNAALNINAGRFATRLVTCVRPECPRTIVFYQEDLPESRHAQGLSPAALETVMNAEGVVIEQLPCDRHNGITYAPDASI